MKKFNPLYLLGSEACGAMAASIYGLVLEVILQQFFPSQFLNSFVSNLGVALSVIFAFVAGYMVDRKSTWWLILMSDLILIPLLLLPALLFSWSALLSIISVLLVDVISIVVSEIDAIARPLYLKEITTKGKAVQVLQHLNTTTSVFSILGYLIVFSLIGRFELTTFFLAVTVLYCISALCISRLPKDKNYLASKQKTSQGLLLKMKALILTIKNKKQILLYASNLIYMVKNQIIMSLLIFHIGKFDPGFKHIQLIGLGLLTSLGFGTVLNNILYKASIRWRKLLSVLLIFLSGLATLGASHLTGVLNYYTFGLLLGAIFGVGLPTFSLLSAERLLVTEEHQGLSLSLLKTLSIACTIFLTVIFASMDKMFQISTIYFDGSSVLSFLLTFLILFIPFKELNNI